MLDASFALTLPGRQLGLAVVVKTPGFRKLTLPRREEQLPTAPKQAGIKSYKI
jgi:hypothetical protein